LRRFCRGWRREQRDGPVSGWAFRAAASGDDLPGDCGYVGRLLGRLPRNTELTIDYTGVGRPVFDLFRYSGVSPVGLLITSGVTEATIDGIAHVPKLVLISQLQTLLHEGRLKIQKDLPEAKILVGELMDFRVQYTAGGHLTFNAREGRHDDLVLALAIACYVAAGGGLRYRGLMEFYEGQLGGGVLPPKHFVGVDLGQSRDPTAVAVVRRVARPSTAEVRAPGFVPEVTGGDPRLQAAHVYATPYAAFQTSRGQKYAADESGLIEVDDPDDRCDLVRAGCSASR